MTRFLALQLGRSHYFDISRARRDFGYTPRVSTAEGMHRLREWLDSARHSNSAEYAVLTPCHSHLAACQSTGQPVTSRV